MNFRLFSLVLSGVLLLVGAQLVKGEMVAEYHKIYNSAALMEIPALHPKSAEKVF